MGAKVYSGRSASPTFRVIDHLGHQTVHDLPGGKCVLPVAVVEGLNVIRIQPPRAARRPVPGHPRRHVAHWTLHDVVLEK
jgi:hypothetical protein